MFTPKRLNRKSSALGLRSPATPLRGGTPGTPSRLESSTVPIKIFELLKSEIECDILPGGFGLAIHNEFIYIWKLKNKLNLCSLPVPAGYTCKPQNVTVVGSSLCYISSTGMGRFWPNVEKSTVWFEFKVILEAGDFIRQVHSDSSRIVAVSNKGTLFNVYVENSVVKYTTLKLPGSRGLVRRVSSMFWSASSQEEEKPSTSLLIGGFCIVCVNGTIYGWDLESNQSNCKFVYSFSDVFGNGKLESVTGNNKYIGFLINRGGELSYLIGPFEEFVVSGVSNFDTNDVNFDQESPLNLVMPYLTQVGIVSKSQIWLNQSQIEREDNILAFGTFDGQIAIITQRGLRLIKTSSKIAETLSSTVTDSFSAPVNNIDALEQLSQSEIPKDRLQAAFIQFNQGNHTEAENLIVSIGNLDSAVSDMSRDIIDEVPLHDPRWNNRSLVKQATGQNSLLIQKQIQEKISKHQLFISFLKERLSLDTLAALSQDGEKLMISKALRNAPSALQSQLDQAIRIVIGQRGLTMQAGLTHQDYYYQKISQIDQIMATFASLVQNSITNSKDRVGKVTLEVVGTIQKINALVCLIVQACSTFRSEHRLSNGSRPWSTIHQDALVEIVKMNGENELQRLQPAVTDQLFIISQFILRDRLNLFQSQAFDGESIPDEGSDFGLLRSQILKIFLDSNFVEEAALLGEEFYDFNTLILSYEHNKDENKLEKYLALEGFPEYVYQHYKGEKLIDIAAQHGGKLAEIVGNDSHHGWLLAIRKNELGMATEKLLEQAGQKEMSLSKRTLLSIAKLTTIANGGNDDDLKKVACEEVLLDYQDKLPDTLLHVSNQTPVLDEFDIIDNMTNGNVSKMTLQNGIDALSVLNRMDQSADYNQMKALIWSRLIESEINTSVWKTALNNSHRPMEALEESNFAKLLGTATEDQLPTADEIKNQQELVDYRDNPVFAFIIGAVIEARHESLNTEMVM